jgi:hypothetical protein
MTYLLANLVAIQRRFLRNDLTFFVINIAIKKTDKKIRWKHRPKAKKGAEKVVWVDVH